MEKITKQETVERLAKLLDLTENRTEKGWYHVNDESKTTFFVDKRYLERIDLIAKLQDFFKDVKIIDGQCRIEPLTIVWTTFCIENVGKTN